MATTVRAVTTSRKKTFARQGNRWCEDDCPGGDEGSVPI
jgi:hypothetical protein